MSLFAAHYIKFHPISPIVTCIVTLTEKVSDWKMFRCYYFKLLVLIEGSDNELFGTS
jgi:hypothetical protein